MFDGGFVVKWGGGLLGDKSGRDYNALLKCGKVAEEEVRQKERGRNLQRAIATIKEIPIL